MKPLPFRFSIYCALLLIGICLNAAPAQTLSRADDKVISLLKKFRADYTKSVLDGKPEMLANYYSETIRLMPEFQKTIMGKANALAYHKAFSSRFDVREYHRDALETLDLGRMIVEIGAFTTKLKLHTTGKEHDLRGKYFTIWEKAENETLSLINEAWNYDHSLEIEEQMRFPEVIATDIALQPHLPVNNNISFELAALNRLMEATVSQHDAAIWAQFYSEDGMFCYSRTPVCSGKVALTSFIIEHCKGLPVFEKLDIRNDRIDHLGNYVIEYASHVAVWRSGERSGVGTGKDLAIWRREKDGSLKIFRHIGMYD